MPYDLRIAMDARLDVVVFDLFIYDIAEYKLGPFHSTQ